MACMRRGLVRCGRNTSPWIAFEDDLRKGQLLAAHPIVQYRRCVRLVVCRARNEDEDGAMLLRMWLEVDAHALGEHW